MGVVALRSEDGVAGLILEHLLWVFVETKRQEEQSDPKSGTHCWLSKHTKGPGVKEYGSSRYGKRGKQTLPTLPEETVLAACS